MVKVFIVKRESKEKKKQAGHGQGYLRENREEQSRGRSQRTAREQATQQTEPRVLGRACREAGKSTNWRDIRVAQKLRGLGCYQDFEMYNKHL